MHESRNGIFAKWKTPRCPPRDRFYFIFILYPFFILSSNQYISFHFFHFFILFIIIFSWILWSLKITIIIRFFPQWRDDPCMFSGHLQQKLRNLIGMQIVQRASQVQKTENNFFFKFFYIKLHTKAAGLCSCGRVYTYKQQIIHMHIFCLIYIVEKRRSWLPGYGFSRITHVDHVQLNHYHWSSYKLIATVSKPLYNRALKE